MSKIRAVVHNGKYHADDVFAMAALKILLDPEELIIIRTRDPKIIDEADYVADVGGIYDPKKRRFDHHMREGAGVRENGIPYASFGLVWKEYGEKIAGSKQAAEYIDRKLVQPIDGPDNGVELIDERIEGVYPYTIQGVLGIFRPIGGETTDIDDVFIAMVALAKRILTREIEITNFSLEAEAVIRTVYEAASNKQLIIFEKDHPFGRELMNSILSEYPEPLYGITYQPDQDNWEIFTISKKSSTFEMRKPFPESWRGKRDQELVDVTGITGSVFSHRAGFMTIVKTKEEALKLAQISLDA